MQETINSYKASLEETAEFLEVLEEAQKTHEKNGTAYNTTKKLLEVYRTLRFDIIAEKIMRDIEGVLHEEADAREINNYDLDRILSMPDNLSFFSSELKKFTNSSIPAACGKLVAFVDAGLRALQMQEETLNKNTHYFEILKASYVDAIKDPRDIFEDLKMSRAVFYVKKDEAITALSIILFGPLGERHPSNAEIGMYINKKFRFYFELADTIDTFCDIQGVHRQFHGEE